MKAIEALVKNGANLDIQAACGNTALHIAFLTRDKPVIKLSLEHGARLDIPNNAGLLPEDLLDVNYKDINPFLYVQCGNDANCYIHTLKNRIAWRFSRKSIIRLVEEHKLSKKQPIESLEI